MPNESSVYAMEGSCAHAVGEMALRSGKQAIDYLGVEIPEFLDVEVDESMCALVQEYLDTVRWELYKYELAGYDDGELGVEIKFDLTHIYPDMWGTCDAVLFLPAWKKLIIFDYKHGWVSVPVERNKQTMYYALGALHSKSNYDIQDIELVIVQPRSGHNTIVKRWTCEYEELMDFKYVLIDAAKRTEGDETKLNPGEWCKFCPAAAVCKALQKRVEELIMAKPDPVDGITMPNPDKLTPEQLKTIWENAPMIEGWTKNVKQYCHAEALRGNYLEGTKFVEGRSNRKWKDEAEARNELEKLKMKGAIVGELINVKLKSPAQIEDVMAKKDRGQIKDLWSKSRGALILVPASDPRPPAKVDAENEFEVV